MGNPLVAAKMTRHDIRAGLYAPLRLFVYEAGDRATHVELRSAFLSLGQFDSPEVTAVARFLDAKLARFVEKAVLLSEGLEGQGSALDRKQDK